MHIEVKSTISFFLTLTLQNLRAFLLTFPCHGWMSYYQNATFYKIRILSIFFTFLQLFPSSVYTLHIKKNHLSKSLSGYPISTWPVHSLNILYLISLHISIVKDGALIHFIFISNHPVCACTGSAKIIRDLKWQ